MTYAPIVVFVYNRLDHAKATIEALKRNPEHVESDLIVFSDAPKTESANGAVLKVRRYLRTIGGFKSVKVVERAHNFGLAKSIVEGVSDVVSLYGRVIVLEDDIVASPAFLYFMNRALDFYSENKTVWHVSGWNYPIETTGLSDVFAWRAMNCWGWGTWSDRWKFFEKNPRRLVSEWTKEAKKDFDLEGSGVFWRQVIANLNGRSNTWAVFWYATIYERKGLCINPAISFVKNIGLDGSGTNSHKSLGFNRYDLNGSRNIFFEHEVTENSLAFTRIKKYYQDVRPSLFKRLILKFKSLTKRHGV